MEAGFIFIVRMLYATVMSLKKGDLYTWAALSGCLGDCPSGHVSLMDIANKFLIALFRFHNSGT